jgi:glucose/arabinose dehydrogenase
MPRRRWAIFAALILTVALTAPPGAQAGESGRSIPSGPTVGLEPGAHGLTSPVQLLAAPGGSDRLFVVDQIGVVRIVTPAGELLDEPFLDVRDRMVSLMPGFDERGLLGLAFHPDYESNGRLFVHYSALLRPGADRLVMQIDQRGTDANDGHCRSDHSARPPLGASERHEDICAQQSWRTKSLAQKGMTHAKT